jgi:hypothetical protein
MLVSLTTLPHVVIDNNMKAKQLYYRREPISEFAFIEAVLWQLPSPAPGSTHEFKYRLALVVNGICVMRYDNESGKGDHRHIDGREEPFQFTTPAALFAAFRADVERIMR